MKKELKEKWIKALRSDEYQQYHGAIGSGRHLCCIGVCASVAGFPQEKSTWFTNDVSEKLHLTSDEKTNLVRMNDTEKCSFNLIADWIETHIQVD